MLTLKAAGLLDVDTGEIIRPGILKIEGEYIVGLGGQPEGEVIDLGDLILMPGMMDMELNLLMGGPGENQFTGQMRDDPPLRMMRATQNARRTLRSGFTTVRNLGLFCKTGGYLLDVALMKAVDNGWIDGPRIIPAGHAITPTGGHLDPTMFGSFAPHVLQLTVEEGLANGVDEVLRAVRHQIKHGAQVIKMCGSGGTMTLTGKAGEQHYSDAEVLAITDEAHRRGRKVAAHTHGSDAVTQMIKCGVDCIEHAFMIDDDTINLMVKHGTYLVATQALIDGMQVLATSDPRIQAKAAHDWPLAKQSIRHAIEAGVKIAVGSDAPAIPHGKAGDELVTLVDRGMTPLQAIQAATIVGAELIDADDRGRLAEGLLADVIAVRDNPLEDIRVVTRVPFVMKGGKQFVY
jgi:imidazolonepropionase-like amidohydrolase